MTADRAVLITGAAGGIGSAVVRRYADDGFRVAATDIDADRLAAVARDSGALALPADGTDRAALAELVGAAVGEFGRLDAIVAAQGTVSPGPADARGDAPWLRALEVNLGGAYYLCGEAIPHLTATRGAIVLISSSVGTAGGPAGTPGYTASKHGLVGLMRYLARDLGPRGVRVNAVCPGLVRAPLGEAAMSLLAQRDGITVEQAYARATTRVPLRRPCEPEEVASVCAFLTSPDASAVTGHALVVDGGGSAVDAATAPLEPPEG
jgi:meso-butanediol dehydrogenase / (S,S)-butanediol dehydrogenase / diacetyl reductase